MAPLVRELWRLGIQTEVACQDAGEAVREGGTRVAEPDRLQTSARLMGRAWLVVQRTDAPRLMGAAGYPGDWLMKPVKKDAEAERWVSITFPRQLIEATTLTLRPLTVEEDNLPSGQ